MQKERSVEDTEYLILVISEYIKNHPEAEVSLDVYSQAFEEARSGNQSYINLLAFIVESHKAIERKYQDINKITN